MFFQVLRLFISLNSIHILFLSFHETTDTCQDIKCSLHSTCYELSPAQCRSDRGFIMSPSTNESLRYDKSRMLRLNNIRFNLPWRNNLSIYESLDFQSLAVQTEEKLLNLITNDLKMDEVVAVKIDEAREGSVVVSA